jgi:hypothetical protein
MTKTYIHKDGALRLYDSTGTPFYYVVDMAEPVSALPTGRARPEEVLILDRENFTALAHYVQGSDSRIAEPLEITISAKLDDTNNYQDLQDALRCGTVSGDVWVTTKGDTQLVSGSGASVTTPAFADAQKKCVNVEILFTFGGTSIGYKLAEVFFEPSRIVLNESMDGVTLQAAGMCYGTITEITGFTAGTESG